MTVTANQLVDQWERVPEQYKQLVREGKMSHAQALSYAAPAKAEPTKAPAKKSLDTTVPDKGSNLEDTALALRTGTNTATSGVVGAPVSVLNSILEPKWAGELNELLDNPSTVQVARALFDKNNKAGILDTLRGRASEEVYGPRGIRQPEAVRGTQESLTISSEEDVKERGSASLKQGLEAMSKADTTTDAIKALIANPKIAPYLLSQQVPNLVINRVPGSTAGTITAQAVSAGSSAESEVYQALQKEVEAGRMTQTEAEEKAAEAGQRSTLINMALPAAFGETGRVTERLLAGQVSKEVAKDAIKKSVLASAGKALGVNTAEEYITEAAEQVSQNIAKGEDPFKGAGAAGTFGAIAGGPIGGVAGGAEAAIQNIQIAEHQKVTAEFDAAQKALEGKQAENKVASEQTKELEKQVEAISKGEAPVIQDLFTGKDVPAEQVAAIQAAKEAAGTAVESEQQTETFNAKVDLAKKIEANQNKDVEALVKEELDKQKEVTEAEEVLKNKNELVSVPSIEQEARQRLAVEQQAIADRPFNKTPEGLQQLPKILANHRANRMFTLKEDIAKERLAKIEQAQKVVDNVKEQEVRTKIEQQVAKEKAKEPTQAALPMKYNQQPKTAERGYTGEMTAEQKVAEGKDMVFKKELASLPPEEAKVLLEETTKAEKAEVAQAKAQEKKIAAVYSKAKNSARATIVEDVRKAMPNADSKDRAVEIGRRMVEWNKANPKESITEAPKPATLTQKILAKEKSRDAKTARTQAGIEQKKAEQVYQSLKKEALDSGLPEKEARVQALDKLQKHLTATESKETLPKEAEATLRDSLRTKAKPETKKEVEQPKALVETNEEMRERNKQELPGYSETIEDSYGEGTAGIIEVLSYMATTDGIRKDYGKLAAKFIPIIKKLNINFEFLPDDENPNNYRGVYDPNTNTIKISNNDPETVLHETLHAITYAILNLQGPFANNNTAKAIKLQLTGLMNHMANYISDNRNKFTPDELHYIDAHALKKNGQLADVHELLTYTMTSPIGQQIALKIPARTGKTKIATLIDNIMSAFIREVGRIFGYGDEVMNTALHDVVMLGTRAIDLAYTNAKDVQAVADSKTQANQEAKPSKDVDKARPVLERTSKVVKVLGKEFKVLNHGTKEDMMGIIKDAVTAGHGANVNVTESLQRASGLVGEYLQRAKARFDTIEKSLKEISKSTGTPLTDVQSAFTKAVEAIEQGADDAKQSLSNALVRNYGDAARAYFANRAEIDSLTDMIIEERLNDPAPFTEKEAAIYSKMKLELGKYYTRSYSSNLKGVKEEYARIMMEAYKAKQEGKSTEHQDQLAQTMEAAIDTIENTFVLIPEPAILEESSLDKLRTLASTWDLKVVENDSMSVQDKKDAFIEALNNFRQDKQHLDPDFTSKRALALATELLKDVEGSPIVSYLKGAKADRTVVEAREKIPPEIRKFLGEYEDIALKGLTTILKQAQFIFQTKALGEIRNSEQAKGKLSKVLSVEEFTEKGYDPSDWTKASGESFGPLEGMYIENSLYDKIKDLQEINVSLPDAIQRADTDGIITAALKGSARGWMKGMSLIKQTQLVFNPMNAAYNLAGGGNILLSNGMWGKNSLKNTKKAMETALALIAAQGSTSVVDPEVSRMIRNNQVDSAYLGSLRGSEMDKVKDLLLAQLGEQGASKISKGKRWTGEKITQAREVYAMMDVVWKIAAFYNRVDTLSEFDKLNGVERDPDAVDRQAAADNSMANFSYSHVPAMVKAIEKFGPSYILPFVYESFRAPFSSMLLGMSDIKVAQNAQNPKASKYLAIQGAKRVLGSLTALTVASTAMHALLVVMSKAMGADEEEDQKLIEKMRPFMADYEKFDDYFVIGKDSQGNPVLFNFNRTDPFDVVSKLTRMIASDADADDYADYMKGLFITNKRAGTLLDAMISGISEDPTGKRATNTRMENFVRPDFIPKDWPSIYESLSSVAGPKTVKAIDAIIPSWVARSLDARNEIVAPKGEVDKMLGVNSVSAILRFGGGQATTVNPSKALKFAVMDYEKTKKTEAERLKSVISTDEVLTPKEYARAFVKASHEERKAFNDLAEKFQGIQGLKYSREEAAGYMEQAGLDKADVNSLLQGTYRPERSLLIPKKSLEALAAEIRSSNDSKGIKQKRARNYNAALEAIRKYNLPVKE